jgi:hypothetical protein
MNKCVDCGIQFDGGPRTKRCPPCRDIQRAKTKKAFSDAHLGYYNHKNKQHYAKVRMATHQKAMPGVWVLVEVPEGCDFKQGAQFSGTELMPEYAKSWVQHGMVFKSCKGVRRF